MRKSAVIKGVTAGAKSLVGVILAASSWTALAQGVADYDRPMLPPDEMAEMLPDLGALAGVYEVDKGGVAAALEKLYADDSALDGRLVGLVASLSSGEFHLTRGGQLESLGETSLALKRNGKMLDLSDACKAWPKNGDRLQASYSGAGVRVTLDVKVQSHVAYMQVNGQPRQVTPGDPGTCKNETSAQTYYAGKMQVRVGPSRKSVPVVVYSLQLP